MYLPDSTNRVVGSEVQSAVHVGERGIPQQQQYSATTMNGDAKKARGTQ